MNDVGVIDRFLEVFNRAIDSGFGLLGPDVQFLSSTLIALDLTLAGLFWALGAEEDVIARLLRKTLSIGFFALLIGNFHNLAQIVFDSFAQLGLKAANSNLNPEDLLRPGYIAQVGFDAGLPLLHAAGDLLGYTSFFTNFLQISLLWCSFLVILIAFFLLALQLFVALIEFKLTTLAGFVLIPFALFSKTAFLAEKVLGNILSSGVKILVFAVIIGIGSTLFGDFTKGFAGEQPTLEEALSIVLAALAMLGLGIFGSSLAAGLVSGGPQLGAGSVAATGLALGGAALGGAVGAKLAAGTAGAITGKATNLARAASHLPSVSAFRSSFSPSQSGEVPAWAQRLKRSTSMTQGASLAAHALQSGERGSSAAVDLKEAP